MKKSTKKMVNRLSRYIGQAIIRTGPNRVTGDRSYLDDPIILKGFTNNGEIIYSYLPNSARGMSFGTNDRVLGLSYTDDQWKLLSKIFKPKGNDFNRYLGQKICRVRPAIYTYIGTEDYSYTDKYEAVKLISATKYHLVIEYTDPILQGKKSILAFEFAKPEDWVLAE